MSDAKGVQEKQPQPSDWVGGLEMQVEYCAEATCDTCGATQEARTFSRASLHQHFRTIRWRIVRRRKDKGVEVTCPACVDKAAEAKAAHKAALDKLRADEQSARDKRRASQKGG